MLNGLNNRMRYTRQTIVSNTFYQMPRFLTAGEFAGNKLNNNARILYTLLDYLSQIKNSYCFRHGKTLVKFSFADTEATLEDKLEWYLLFF